MVPKVEGQGLEQDSTIRWAWRNEHEQEPMEKGIHANTTIRVCQALRSTETTFQKPGGTRKRSLK